MRAAGFDARATSASARSWPSRRTFSASESASVRSCSARSSASATSRSTSARARRRASSAVESTRASTSARRLPTSTRTACSTPSRSDPAVPPKDGLTVGSVTVPVTFTGTDTTLASPRSRPTRPALEARRVITSVAPVPSMAVGTASDRS